MTVVIPVTASELQPGDKIHDSQRPDFGFPPLKGTVTLVEPHERDTAIWLDTTGDMRWLIPGQAMVNIRRASG